MCLGDTFKVIFWLNRWYRSGFLFFFILQIFLYSEDFKLQGGGDEEQLFETILRASFIFVK